MLSPITGKDSTTRLGSRSPAEIAAQWKEELQVQVGPRFKALPAIEHWRCDATGFEWYAPPAAAGEAELYSQLQRLDWYYLADKWEFGAALGHFEKHHRILEIGSGAGHFLAAARARDMDAMGLELNPVAAAQARAAGFSVLEEDLQAHSLRLQGNHYDAVCAFQVLEHVPEPMSMLRQMLALLKPGGKLVVSVPNATVLRLIDPHGKGLLDQPPHHMSKWSAGVFRALPAYLPVELVEIRREPLQPYHVGWCVQSVSDRIRTSLGRRLGRLVVNRFSLRAAHWILRTAVRQLIPGHTVLAVYRKTA